MFVAHLTLNLMASVFTGIAAVTYLIGHPYPRLKRR